MVTLSLHVLSRVAILSAESTSRRLSMSAMAFSATYKLIDIGANLTDPVFRGNYRGKQKHESDFDDVLERSRKAGVEKCIITAGTLAEAKEALIEARKHDMLFSTCGVHPTRCQQEFLADGTSDTEYMEELKKVIDDGKSDGKIVAVGEFGLDYDRLEFCPKDVQLKYFARQFELAEYAGLPLFFHMREAAADFIDVVRKHRDSFKHGVVHSFTGTAEEAKELIELDLFIGINGCSLKTQDNVDVMCSIPTEKLMIETDAPWCDIRPTHASHTHVNTKCDTVKRPDRWVRGAMVKGRNEPCNVVQVLEVIANAKGEDVSEVADVIYRNTHRVFFS
eukprot:TRINITY_DN12943_c0_g1_i1.p1 TRINITY_DN12943_c0_g1~~TRINITY_DN12943_c0_g1_i1.p1  ORF type:complete len:335 (-),score=54.43 TRINITY_DN12943_c0_g1_i1:107-1111(-)